MMVKKNNRPVLMPEPKWNYSKMEKRILAVFLEQDYDWKIVTTKLTDLVYANRERPLSARQALVSCLFKLGVKVNANGEAFAVRKSEQCGGRPTSVWLTPAGRDQ